MRIASLLALLAAFILLAGCEELGDPQVPPAVEPQGQGSTEPVISEPEIERIEELVPHTDGTIDPNPTVPPITPSDVLDPTGSVEPTAPTEQVQAEAGVGEQGQSLTPGNMITEPARAFFSAKQSIIFANAEHALQLYKATNDSVPQSTEEYMEQVIKANSIQLPELRKGQRYVFDPESENFSLNDLNRNSMKIVASVIAGLLIATAGSSASAVDWMFAPSTFTHDPATAQRVNQYAEVAPAYSFQSPDYLRSGYRHNTSVNRVRGSADRIHVVEEWGRAVRPYGEWQRPYRPYSVPYDAWGPPFGGLGYGGPIYGGPAHGGLGFGGGPGYGPPGSPTPHPGALGFGGAHDWPLPWLGPYSQPPEAQRPQRRSEPDDRFNSHRPERPAYRAVPETRGRSDWEQQRSADGAYGRIQQGAT